MTQHKSILKSSLQENYRVLGSSVAVSIGLHLAVVLTLVLSASFSFGGRSSGPVLPVMNVSMITLGDAAAGPVAVAKPPQKAAPAPAPAAPPKPVASETPPPVVRTESPAPAPEVMAPRANQPKVSLKHETLQVPEEPLAPRADQPKTSLKHETFQPAQAMQEALSRLEQEVTQATPEPPADTLEDTLARLRAKVGETDPVQTSTAAGGSGRRGAGTGGGGTHSLRSIDVYRAMLAGQIEHNWAFNEQLAGGRTDLSTIIMIRIAASGEIQDIWFEKKSGNRFLDDSADKAVRKSNPLPPLPSDYPQSHYTLGLIFTAAGLSRG